MTEKIIGGTWQIVDDEGLVYSGQEEEIRQVWLAITTGEKDFGIEWTGDLRLIEIHGVYNG